MGGFDGVMVWKGREGKKKKKKQLRWMLERVGSYCAMILSPFDRRLPPKNTHSERAFFPHKKSGWGGQRSYILYCDKSLHRHHLIISYLLSNAINLHDPRHKQCPPFHPPATPKKEPKKRPSRVPYYYHVSSSSSSLQHSTAQGTQPHTFYLKNRRRCTSLIGSAPSYFVQSCVRFNSLFRVGCWWWVGRAGVDAELLFRVRPF